MCLVFMQDRFWEKEWLAQRLCTFYILIGSTKLPSSGVQFRLPLTAHENLFPHQKWKNSCFPTKSFFAQSGKTVND